MKLGMSWLKGGKTVAELSKLMEQAQGLLTHLESLKGGLLPDHAIEEMGKHVREHLDTIKGMIGKLPEGEVKEKATAFLSQVLNLTTPLPETKEEVQLRSVYKGEKKEVTLPAWLHWLNEQASSSSGSAALNKLTDFIKNFIG